MALTLTYHRQSNGQAETMNKAMKTYLRCYVGSNPTKWVSCLSMAEWCYNTKAHSSILVSPFEVLYGFFLPKLLACISETVANVIVDKELTSKDQL